MGSSIKPLVVVVGRPNVGKSTLFNRLLGQPKAIVSEVSGTTRDRVTSETVWGDHAFILVDTGGLDFFSETDLWRMVKSQIDLAINEADVIVMVVDANVGITPDDMDVAHLLRRANRPVVVAVNKADNPQREVAAVEFHQLGLGDPIPVSAHHNIGIDDLMVQVIRHMPSKLNIIEPDADLKLAIVGRTNVGKSMLVNAITSQDRSIVSEIPGTTRDALDTVMTYKSGTVLLIDTAGIRRSGKVEAGIERYSTLRSIRAIDRADVAVLVMDASELATAQDTHIVSFILDAYKGIFIAVNKWDLSPNLNLNQEQAVNNVRGRFKFIPHAPMCFISALDRLGIDSFLDMAHEVHSQWTKAVPRYELKRTVMNAVAEHPPSSSGRRSLKIYSVAQDQSSPPSFTFYVNHSDMVHFSYQRYLENTIREAYGFRGAPLRMRFRGRGDR